MTIKIFGPWVGQNKPCFIEFEPGKGHSLAGIVAVAKKQFTRHLQFTALLEFLNIATLTRLEDVVAFGWYTSCIWYEAYFDYYTYCPNTVISFWLVCLPSRLVI